MLHAMPAKTLHIVDGDCAWEMLRTAGFAKGGVVLSWRDALYTGPVPATLKLRQLSRVRSRFWTDGRKSAEFDKRDAVVANYAAYGKVALWLGEDCVLCQLSLIQILSCLHEHGMEPKRLEWVRVHAGELHPEQIANAYYSRQPVTAAMVRLVERAWRAFRRDSPGGMVRLLKADLSGIPSLRGALTRLLQEYPEVRSGLSRLESDLLREIRKSGKAQVLTAVGSVITREYVGDTLLIDMLRNFVLTPVPLLRFAEPFQGRIEQPDFVRSILELTEVGRRVLRGSVDHIAINGVDRWIGGVHLHGKVVPWRWNRKTRSLLSVTARGR
jgi:hypothetical protein